MNIGRLLGPDWKSKPGPPQSPRAVQDFDEVELVLKMMDSLLKMMDSLLKMMDVSL